MSYLPFALLAYFFNSVSVLIDKYLLVKRAPNPFYYIFYISLFSELVLIAAPFVKIPSSQSFIFASLSTLLWTGGAYFMFRALKVGNASRVIPVIGTLIPIILSWIGFVAGNLTLDQLWAIIVLVLGLFFLVIPYLKGKISKEEIVSVVVSALLYADSYVVLKWAYDLENFGSVFVYSRVILIPILLLIFIWPSLRKKILQSQSSQPKQSFFSKGGWLFLIGQASGGASQMLLTFSISLAYPALVNSLQGIQYVFLFIAGLFLSRKLPNLFGEKLSPLLWLSKIIGILLIAAGLFFITMADKPLTDTPKTGVTFSPKYALELGMDPLEVYSKMFTELKIKHVRLPVYWSEFEKSEGIYDTDYLTDYLDMAEKNQAKVMVAVGYKSPRWPECHPPEWAKNLSRGQLQQKILLMLQKTISLYKNHPAVESWQIENEPFLPFGDCLAQNPLTYDFIKQEFDLAKKIDNKPVLITDSGEVSDWRKAMSINSYFGTTLYRQVWHPYLGYLDYPLPASFYVAKKWLIEKITGVSANVIISELQAEPWVPSQQSIIQWDIEDQLKSFPPGRLTSHFLYAKSTGFPEIYLWGVEWWFWMKKNGFPEYINTAKSIFALKGM